MAKTPDKFRDHDQPDARMNQIIAAYYQECAKRMKNLIINPPGRSPASQEWNQARATMIGSQIANIQKEMNATAAGWTGSALSKAMAQGTKTAEKQAIFAGVRRDKIDSLQGSFHVLDPGVAKQFASDTYSDLAGAADSMSKGAQSTLRRMAAQGVSNADVNTILAGGVIEGKPVQAIRELKVALEKIHGETITIQDKNGDPMTFSAGYYAKMVAVTKTRQAVCQSRHARLADLGLDLVTIVGKISNNFCSAYLDKVFSISGNHPKYPPLSSLPGGGPPFHPNCSKSTAPFVEELATPAETDAAEPDADLQAMTATKNTSQLQRHYQDLQLRQAVEQRHDDVVESITGQKPVKERLTISGKETTSQPSPAPALKRSTPTQSTQPTLFNQPSPAKPVQATNPTTQALRQKLDQAKAATAQVRAQLEQLRSQVAEMKAQLAQLTAGDPRIAVLKAQIATIEKFTRRLDRQNDKGN
jgi:hypothetical protein